MDLRLLKSGVQISYTFGSAWRICWKLAGAERDACEGMVAGGGELSYQVREREGGPHTTLATPKHHRTVAKSVMENDHKDRQIQTICFLPASNLWLVLDLAFVYELTELSV